MIFLVFQCVRSVPSAWVPSAQRWGPAWWMGYSITTNPQSHSNLVWWCQDLLSLQIWQVFWGRPPLDTDFSGGKSEMGCAGGWSLQSPVMAQAAGIPTALPLGSPSPHLIGADSGMWSMLLLCWMCVWDLSVKSWSFHAEIALLLFPKRSWGVFALSHLPSGLGLKIKIVERKNPDGDSAGLDVKISFPLWVGAHLYTWFMPVGMRGTDLTNDRFWMVASNVINVCWLGALPNFELLSIVWGWTRAAWVLKYFHIK